MGKLKSIAMENDPPRRVTNPGVMVVNESSLVVSWEPGDESATKYDVSVCGHDIFKEIMAEPGDFIQCKLEDLKPNTEYKIQIVAIRDRIKSDPVFVNARTKICPFKCFETLNSTESAITIECPEPDGPKDVYYVSLHECTDRKSRGDLVKEETIKANGRLVYSFDKLVAGRCYHVTVKCGTSSGAWSEERTVDVSTKVARPANCKALYGPKTPVIVKWDHPNGDRDGYILQTVPKGKTIAVPTNPVNKDETSCTMGDLEPGTEYNVSLQTTCKGYKSEPAQLSFRTFPAKVENIKVSSDEPGTLSVGWDEAPGRKDHYMLSLSIGATAAPIQRIQVQPIVGQRSVAPRWIKDDLVPLARYVVTVTTFSGDKASEECRNAQVIKPHPPQITVNDEDITSNSIHLSWSVSEGSPGETWYKFDEVPEARVKNYILSISPKHAMPSIVIKTPDETENCPEHTFTNLQSGTEYTLTVYVQCVDRSSEVVMTAESECKSWTLPEKPGHLQIEEPSPTTVKVSWSPSNGRVDHYLIEMKSESMTSKGILKKLETKGTTCTFHDVDPFVTYVISVQAIRGLRKSEAAFAEKRPVYEEQQGPLVFISHAGEDKEAFVEPLLAALFEEGLSEGDIFFDKFSIFTGDTIRHEIVSAISNKTLKLFVLVVSKNFFGKNKYWPRLEYELSLKENIPLYPIWLDENDDNFKNFSSFVGGKSSLLKGKRATCVGYTENADDVKKAAREIAFKVSPWLKPQKSTTTDDIPERGESKRSCEHRHNEDVPQSHKHGEETPGQAQGDDDVTRLNKQTQAMEQSGWEVVTLMINKKTGEKRTIASLASQSFLESNPDMAARFQQFVMTSNQSEALDSDSSHAG